MKVHISHICYCFLLLNSAFALYVPRLSTSPVLFSSVQDNIRNNNFETWIIKQKEVSFQGILNNIGGISDFLNETEVAKGAVIASPSKNDPDYFYQWTRDAALTIKSLIYYIQDAEFEGVDHIKLIVESYIENNYYLQRLDNKSGRFDDDSKSGLGEPKFHADNTAFNEHWGRPQRDGPGLRVITILSYLSLLDKFEKGVGNTFLGSKEFIYQEIVKPDLIYISKNWQEEGFDLWEEISSLHFFGSITQLRALKDGVRVAKELKDDPDFIETLQNTYDDLKAFIVEISGYAPESHPYIIETPSYLKSGKRSGLDSAVLLGSIHSHNIESNDHADVPFDVTDGRILNTLSAMVGDMKYRYPINHNKIGFERGIGAALGRYPEDVYDGHGTSEGNPWFLSTATAAEVIYKFLYKLGKNRENIVVNSENKDFFKDFIDIERIETEADAQIVIPYGSTTYVSLTRNLFHYSDSFLEIIKDHVDNSGHMSEQFNKYHGYMQGATDLTWSYSAVWNSFRWRERASRTLNKI
ncbi:glycoside hydrolase family 15 protein [Suhomyces tanzawaensis NRRL Y-17324]|uniref:glucan 1,4-alpha-glucosidase n=1 Tax=Suhomyces tanzawaensis NRRL Y-17324 TaxID=984487 RepID=A0A1E4SBA9_9ASCO|nr:glycoside hydrolase family 15 protein [Suhomyces tanzawaensis NRRL Y-17324]ODV76804.1 glycoside hydrolase family 15 protein [Suhomyces tanzawaensis NRRL Y-17324]